MGQAKAPQCDLGLTCVQFLINVPDFIRFMAIRVNCSPYCGLSKLPSFQVFMGQLSLSQYARLRASRENTQTKMILIARLELHRHAKLDEIL